MLQFDKTPMVLFICSLKKKKKRKHITLTFSCSKTSVHGQRWERHRPERELRVRVSASGRWKDSWVLGTFQGWHRNGTHDSCNTKIFGFLILCIPVTSNWKWLNFHIFKSVHALLSIRQAPFLPLSTKSFSSNYGKDTSLPQHLRGIVLRFETSHGFKQRND